LTAGEIERICLQWGLVKVDGFTIDGQAVDAEALAARGPEDLAREVIDAIRFECGLTPEERKN
ncbi:MAG TPA: hypothetical protein VEQ63_11870, partial [Bryobacteraceae bacterium]|nr:hypothetical protein [Bryobacteraceae bacterium]